jgi:transcriptional regulator with XRE-family HTH domain
MVEKMKREIKLTTILSKIEEQRKKLGLSKVAAAKQSGLGRNFVADVERGKPTVEFGKVLDYMMSIGLTIQIKPVKDHSTEHEELKSLVDSLFNTNPELAQRVVSGLTDQDKQQLNSNHVRTPDQMKRLSLTF